MQVSIHDRRRMRLDEGVACGTDDEIDRLRIEAVVRLHHLNGERGSQDGKLLVGGGGLREGHDEVAGEKIHAIHGSCPEETNPSQDRQSGDGTEMPGDDQRRRSLAAAGKDTAAPRS